MLLERKVCFCVLKIYSSIVVNKQLSLLIRLCIFDEILLRKLLLLDRRICRWSVRACSWIITIMIIRQWSPLSEISVYNFVLNYGTFLFVRYYFQCVQCECTWYYAPKTNYLFIYFTTAPPCSYRFVSRFRLNFWQHFRTTWPANDLSEKDKCREHWLSKTHAGQANNVWKLSTGLKYVIRARRRVVGRRNQRNAGTTVRRAQS